ncbi:Ankyrin repeat protein 1 [Giardia muris]|uniref:Ankyrin repeat protein 1 n=1 Tax=Giardia muris TaxID=5742 RepID=A0A4Z1SSZ5_GIAMU|nr:Ankyrin repeat protein 1 [Giardia muris]|eukprot:TNJ29004.1 Ankyrin repeat protein 1 [Giardia muris]
MCFCTRPKKHDYSWFAACQAGRLDEVKTKLGRMRTQRDNRPSGVGIYPGFTGLLYACLNGRIEVAQLLLEHEFAEYATEQADITLYGTSGSRTYTVTAGTTPLMLAILEGHMQIAMLFLDFATQNPDKIEQILCVRNQQGHCALMCLCMIQQSGLVEFLKKSSELVLRYEIELVSADGCTALQIAALYGRNFLLDSIFKVMFVREINSLDDMRLRIKFVTALLQRDNNNHDIFYHANDMQRGTAYNAEDSSKRTCSIIVLPVMQDVVKWILANPVEEAKAQLSSPLSRNNNTLMKHPLSSDLLVGMQPKDFQQNFCETKDLEVLEQANRIDCYRNYCQILKIEQNERLITQAKAYIVNGKFVGPEAQKFGQARDATAGVSKHRRDESELSGDTTNDSVRPPSVFMRMNQDGVLIIDNENGEERLALGVSNVDAPFDENFDEN